MSDAATSDYAAFLESKRITVPSVGVTVDPNQLHAGLFPFQRDLVRWSLQKGRAGLLADTGLGKTPMQLEWARMIGERTLILAPLAVARQTVREGAKWGIPVKYARAQYQAAPEGITITNYEMLPQFEPSQFGAVVLDESGILKNFEGKVRTGLIKTFSDTPYKLACTATPAPNDIAELANHAEFLGVMTRVEMLATFFVHDEDGWRLRGHARDAFYRWLASWAMTIKRPSDLGYSDDGYVLPELSIKLALVPTDYTPPGQLFSISLSGIGERSKVRRDTLAARVQQTADLILSEPDEQWLAWVGLNDEGRELVKLIPDAVLVEGSDNPDAKAEALMGFADGNIRVLISKTSISGFGMNWQNCARMVFCGLSDSYESYYQAIRRCWRFGQQRPVIAHVVLTEPEEPIYQNVLRKEREAAELSMELVRYVAEFEKQEIGNVRAAGDVWAMNHEMEVPEWLRAS
jgi:hypothetical protein